MTATVEPPTGSVLLRLDNGAGDGVTALRQQLALCLATGITHIQVDVGRVDDLGLPALQALQGVADYLQRRGGGLVLTGARQGVLSAVAQSDLQRLLPAIPTGPGRDRPEVPPGLRPAR